MPDVEAKGSKKAYVCNRWPGMSIRDKVAFKDGLFETDDPDLQALVESNEQYGINIHPQEGGEPPKPEEPTPAEPGEPASMPGFARQGGRGTR